MRMPKKERFLFVGVIICILILHPTFFCREKEDTIREKRRNSNTGNRLTQSNLLEQAREPNRSRYESFTEDSPQVRLFKVKPYNEAVPSTLEEEEVLKRKIKNDVIELMYSIESKLLNLPDSNSLKQKQKALKQLTSQHNNLMIDVQESLDFNNEWKKREMNDLQDLIQKRIHFVQNPLSCDNARKLICLTVSCGFGCQLHNVGYCLMVAFGTNRTMVLKSEIWKYEGHDTLLQPVSNTCKQSNGWSPKQYVGSSQTDLEVYFLPVYSTRKVPNHSPQAIPEEIARKLKGLHGQPGVWWVAQFTKYLMRSQEWLQASLKEYENQVNYSTPIVGIHVRRTDKIGTEASFHSVHEYMEHVAAWYDLYDMKHNNQEKIRRRVYLATDDPKVLDEAKKNFEHYEFVNFLEFSQTAVKFQKRNQLEGLKGIISDIHLLSHCNYIVCTFSSQVCRAAYELMQTRRPDASFDAHSLDDIYFYAGQRDHRLSVVYEHEHDASNNEIELRIGDVIITAGNHWNGYSKGRNTRTGNTGLFPSWKAVDIVEEVKYPTYPEASKRIS